MPKLIPQLEDHIIQTAENLFAHNGFDGVSMRRLAAELNIAVGTLYNYFPNKTVLFYSIMERSWRKTFAEICKLIAATDKITSESRRRAIELIYSGIKKRGAFALKTFEPAKADKHSHKLKFHYPDWQQRLTDGLAEILAPLEAGFSGPDKKRTIKTILAAIRFFISSSESNDRNGDIDFLLKIAEMS